MKYMSGPIITNALPYIFGMGNMGGSQPHAAPTAQAPYGQAVQQAMGQYPWLNRFGNGITLTSGTGPYQSESYMPKAEDNPLPGHYTVELRSDQMKHNPAAWPALIGREGVDWLARSDPTYQRVAQQFIASMTPAQRNRSYARWQREQQLGEKRSFDDFLRGAEAQEYIGGYLVPEMGMHKDEAGYTPEQIKLLNGLQGYLRGGKNSAEGQ